MKITRTVFLWLALLLALPAVAQKTSGYVILVEGNDIYVDLTEKDVKAGDFDSLGFVPEGALTYPAEKNFTDGEIALELLLGRGCTRIDIYGAGGGREDHLFGNLQLLLAGFRRGAFTVMHTNYVDAYCARGQVCWRGLRGRTLSLAPAGERAHIIESEGLKYPLCDLTLRAGSCRGISNVIAADEARILCDAGTLFVFEVREEATW